MNTDACWVVARGSQAVGSPVMSVSELHQEMQQAVQACSPALKAFICKPAITALSTEVVVLRGWFPTSQRIKLTLCLVVSLRL